MKITEIHAGYQLTVPGPVQYSSKQFRVDLQATVDETENPLVAHDELSATAVQMVTSAAQEAIKAIPAKLKEAPQQAAPAPQAQPQQQQAPPPQQHAPPPPPEGTPAPPLGEINTCMNRIFDAMGVTAQEDFKRKDLTRNILRHVYKWQGNDGAWKYTMAKTPAELLDPSIQKYTPKPGQWAHYVKDYRNIAQLLENGDRVEIAWTKWDRDAGGLQVVPAMLEPKTQGYQNNEPAPAPAPAPSSQDFTQDDVPF
jgi:hypothetical protein